KSKQISNRQKQLLRVYDIPKASQKYALFEPLHELWNQYMGALNITGTSQASLEKILKADLHGCILTVVKSKCPSLVGQRGIVVQETKNMFKVITKNDELKSLSKAATVFCFTYKNMVYSIFGDQFRFTTSERVARKFKPKSTVDL
ncbi:Rof/RNase P-like protein, partial [Dimargaris cristalligena]